MTIQEIEMVADRVMRVHEERAAVVQEALAWVGTPYHHRARIKGAGVDCGQFLAVVYPAAGVVPGEIDPGEYPHDWHLHRGDERYLDEVRRYAREIDGPPRPGDVAVFRFGRAFAHGAIVLDWPKIIHSYVGLGVLIDDATENGHLVDRPVRFFSPWGEA